MKLSITAPHPFGADVSFTEIRLRMQSYSLWEDRYRELIKLSRLLPPLSEELRNSADEISGCENRVWLGVQHLPDGKLHFYGDSEGRIVKGLLAILLSICEGKNRQSIADLDLSAIFAQTGLLANLSASRSSGLTALIATFQRLATR
jgi:cysteine desulfuration protein SufE